ncbi:MAG: hypothetical protein EXS10_00345 [Phycisphaerales bacterium]|nr:hypothetical protein [Phycisphaerales bacterium]
MALLRSLLHSPIARITLLLLAWTSVSVHAQETTAVPSDRQATRVAIVPITGEIDDLTMQSVERRLQAARAQGFDAVVIEIDTPGGEVTATLDIIQRLRSDAPSNTIAWIHPKAYSAGTLIALSCREVVISTGGVFGDAAPIAVSAFTGLEPLPETERAKLESPLLEVLAEAAEKRGDDVRLLNAFVQTGHPLWLVERASDGSQRTADAEDLARFGLQPTALPPGGSRPQSSPRKPTRASASDFSSTDAWRIVEPLVAADALLVVRESEALRYGLAVAVIDNDAQLQAFFGAQSTTRFTESWMEPVARFLMSWPIRILLVAAFLVFVAIEFVHPGFGVFGILATICLALLVSAPALIGLAAWWHVLLVGAGVVLLLAEIFIAPGIGIAAIAGSGMLIVGLVLTLASTDPESAPTRGALANALATLAAGGVVGVLVFWFMSRTFRESPLFRRAMLATSLGGPNDGPPRAGAATPLVGACGIAITDLRPAGRAEFLGEPFDVQSTGGYIDRGASLVVLRLSTGTLIVDIAPSTAPREVQHDA